MFLNTPPAVSGISLQELVIRIKITAVLIDRMATVRMRSGAHRDIGICIHVFTGHRPTKDKLLNTH
jgi:hypothetical protein